MADMFASAVAKWLQANPARQDGVYELEFDERHFGNPFVRSLHGGVTGSMIELSAEAFVRRETGRDDGISIVSNVIDYLRITKDKNLFARPEIQRISRRLAVVDVTCWQDSEDIPVARGVVTLRIQAEEKSA